jgi:phosphoribosylformylglycinamidine synthase
MIFLLGETKNSISSSLYLKSYHKVKNSPPPFFCLKTAHNLQRIVSELFDNEYINSAHDISNGGLIVTLVEAALYNNLGFDITTDAENRNDAFLFGEAQNRIVVTVNPKNETDFIDFMMEQKFPFLTLGHITKGDLRIDDISWGNISEIKDLYENSIEKKFKM